MVDVNGKNYGVIQKASKFKAFAQRIIATGEDFGFDIEAGYTGEDKKGVALKPYHPDWLFVGFSFTNSLDWARYVPVNHDDESVNIDDRVETARWLWKMLWTGNGVAHNALYELNGLSRWFRETLSDDEELGEEVSRNLGLFPVKSDTMVQAHQVAYYDPVLVGVGLKSLVKHVFGHEMTVFEDLFGELKPAEKKFLRFNILGITDGAVEYACEDAVWCLALHKLHYDDVKGSVIEEAESGLLPVLARMEMEGLVLNWDLVDSKLKEAEEFRDKMAEEIFTSLSERLDEVVQFNLNSTAQLAEILFNRLGIKPKMKSKTTGKPSTSEKALRLVAQSDPIVRRILEYREVVKLIGSYLKKYKNELNYAGNQRAYPNHKSVGALTGRFSVDGVSYQQWPKPYFYKLADGTEFHMSFRDLLLSPENHRIVGYDFSQVELRVMAGLANEKVMIEAFNNGEDIHKLTYSRMTGKPFDQVTKAERAVGKALANSEVVLTPNGWIPMGEIQVGDEVVIPSGGKTRVEAVFPQGVRSIYNVKFEDGTVVKADGDHLWPVYHVGSGKESLKTTDELLEAGLASYAGKNGTKPFSKWAIRNVAPLEFDGWSDLPIEPYFVGIMLGDGSFAGPSLTLSIGDQDAEETIARVTPLLHEGVSLLKKGPNDYRVSTGITSAYVNSMDRDFRGMSLKGTKEQFGGTFGVRSWEKFIPEEYKYSSIEQRYEILRGIMDADGTVDDGGRALLTTTSLQLAEDVVFVARSLGGRAKIVRSRNTKYTYLDEKKSGRLSYEVLVSTPDNPFNLKRKADRWEEIRVRKGFRSQDKKITAIEYSGEEEATCIRVEDADHEFITAGVTRTHNTLSFATVYGSGPSNIAEMISTPEKPVTTEDAEKLLKQYYEAYPALATWMAERRYEGRTTGNVYTPFGRKFHVWEYLSDKKFIQEKGDRMCVNAPVQGGAADIMKIGMVRAQRAIDKAGLSDKIKMVMTIHDALEFYVHDSVDTQTVIDLVSPATSFPIPGMPEIKADWHEGKTMGTFVEINLDEDRKIKSYAIDGDAWKGMEWDTYEEAEYYLHHPEEMDREEKTRDGHTTVVTLSEMPTKSQWTEFRKLLGERPGPDKLVVNTPQGTINPQDGASYDLPKDVFNKISSIFGGAHVKVL